MWRKNKIITIGWSFIGRDLDSGEKHVILARFKKEVNEYHDISKSYVKRSQIGAWGVILAHRFLVRAVWLETPTPEILV